ncbi:MAG TPA: peptidylprolyl isomerase [Candidatus Nanoarchaeia archaeon]|nr:peptidylprolyl isomerase [Candidatus Nanoarchaeia archaeon]
MPIKQGSKVKVEYTGKLEDGSIFDSSKNHGVPLEFEVGAGQIIQGFDEAIIGMEKNDQKEVKIPAEKAYGTYNPELTRQIPRDSFPEDQEVKVGMIVGLQLPNGAQFPAKIVDLNEQEITLDLNHPLAGKTLIFEIKIVDYS